MTTTFDDNQATTLLEDPLNWTNGLPTSADDAIIAAVAGTATGLALNALTLTVNAAVTIGQFTTLNVTTIVLNDILDMSVGSINATTITANSVNWNTPEINATTINNVGTSTLNCIQINSDLNLQNTSSVNGVNLTGNVVMTGSSDLGSGGINIIGNVSMFGSSTITNTSLMDNLFMSNSAIVTGNIIVNADAEFNDTAAIFAGTIAGTTTANNFANATIATTIGVFNDNASFSGTSSGTLTFNNDSTYTGNSDGVVIFNDNSNLTAGTITGEMQTPWIADGADLVSDKTGFVVRFVGANTGGGGGGGAMIVSHLGL